MKTYKIALLALLFTAGLILLISEPAHDENYIGVLISTKVSAFALFFVVSHIAGKWRITEPEDKSDEFK